MKKMNLFVKSVFGVVLLLGGSMSLASAANFKMNLTHISMVDPNSISPIHFKDNNNDFGGFIYFSNGTGEAADLEGEYVDEVEGLGADGKSVTYKCKKKLKGFYYNSERGERLWPLDRETRGKLNQNGDNLDMDGGLFTLCVDIDALSEAKANCQTIANEQDIDINDCIKDVEEKFAGDNGYYGAITHEYESQKFVLVAGVNYQQGTHWIEMKNEIAPTFERFDNKFPVGFIYDPNGGIGFVGCELTGSLPMNVLSEIQSEGIENLFEYTTPSKTGIQLKSDFSYLGLNCNNIGSAGNSLIGLIIQGLVGMGRDTDTGILGNATDPKMQYFSSANINNATLMNYSRQRAENLCRGKWNSTADLTKSIICIDNPPAGVLDASSSNYRGKTIIVKNGDVKVSPDASEDESHYDIFVGSGNLIISESSPTLFVFKKDGFVSETEPSTFKTMIETEIEEANTAGRNFEHVGEDVAVAALLKGNFIVNGGVKADGGNKLLRKYFVHGKFTTKDTFDTLGKVFKWRCVDGVSNESEKYYCPYSQEHPYTNAFLVVIDQNYSSPLFR